MSVLDFYDVDPGYIEYLKQIEINARGFTCVPNIEYGLEQKFLCGVVLEIGDLKYYVPVTSYKKKQSESILIVFESDRFNKIKGSLRFNFMFPISDEYIRLRIIKNEPDAGRRVFLNAQLQFCKEHEAQIYNQARRTYNIVTKELNKNILHNACMFKLLEEACINYRKDSPIMQLIFPTIAHKIDALAYRQEHFDNGETSIHGDGGLDHAESYESWLDKLQVNLTRDDGKFVPSATYFGMVDGRIVGTVDIRYRLNDYLMLFGGHIGYSVRPCERHKGYATQMLALALNKCRELGIERVLITCNKGNDYSAKTITKNGGVLENEVAEEDGTIVERYWVDLST